MPIAAIAILQAAVMSKTWRSEVILQRIGKRRRSNRRLSVSAICGLGGAEGVDDVLEQVLQVRTNQQDDGNCHDRDQRCEQRVLNHVLAFFSLEATDQVVQHILQLHLLCDCEFDQHVLLMICGCWFNFLDSICWWLVRGYSPNV